MHTSVILYYFLSYVLRHGSSSKCPYIDMLAIILTARPLLQPPGRSPPVRAQAPLESFGVELQRKLGEGSFAEVTSGAAADAVGQRGLETASVSAARVRVGLFYGQLTGRSSQAGTRVLVKAYCPDGQPPWAEEVDAGGTEAEQSDAASLNRALASGQKSGASLAEALALNEFAAHSRLQLAQGFGDTEQRGVVRLLGRTVDVTEDGSPIVLMAFPWRGEQVRMALPTALPPTLASWAARREQGGTEAQRLWPGVPLRAAQQRGKFIREALRGALVGLETLHSRGLLHQALSPSAILISSEDDRKGEAVKAQLETDVAHDRVAGSETTVGRGRTRTANLHDG